MYYPPHPYADIFPMMEDSALRTLTHDIDLNGLREPIILYQRMVLDGRNRQIACSNSGRSPIYEQFFGDDDAALSFVISKNFERRHLTGPQRDAVAAEIANLKRGGQEENTNASKNESLKLDVRSDATSLSDAAKRMGRSRASVAKAKAVKEKAPEVFAALKGGRINTDTAKKIADLPEDKRMVALEDVRPDQAVKKLARVEKERTLAKSQSALPEKRFGVVYADPEWKFETYSDNGMDRSADNHYPTSGIDEICARDVPSIAADDCVLFLWATVPMLPEALRVMAAWGFKYKSHAIWNKDKIGTGYWFRNKHELLLVGTKGSIPAPAMGTQRPSVIDAFVGSHSAKPEQVYELIEEYFPNLPKIELNARNRREGWAAWGNEVSEAAE